MSQIQTLRSFVNERLSVAVEEIFVEVERILTEYEDQAFSSKQQIEQQQRILDVVLKPDIRLHKTDIPEQRQRIVKMFEEENDDDDDDEEDFPGSAALENSLERVERSLSWRNMEEPPSPLQVEEGQGETGWSTLRLADVKSRGDTVSDVSSEVQDGSPGVVQKEPEPPEIKEEPEEVLIIPEIADASTLPDRKPQLDTLEWKPQLDTLDRKPQFDTLEWKPQLNTLSDGHTQTERRETNAPFAFTDWNVKPSRGRPRKGQVVVQVVGQVVRGRGRGRPRKGQEQEVVQVVGQVKTGPEPGTAAQDRSRTRDGCARTNRYDQPHVSHPIYPIAHDSPRLPVCKEEPVWPEQQERNSSHSIYPIAHDSPRLPVCKAEPVWPGGQQESNSNSSLVQEDCGTSSQPALRDLAPLSYCSDSDSDTVDSDDWEEMFEDLPVRKPRKKAKMEGSWDSKEQELSHDLMKSSAQTPFTTTDIGVIEGVMAPNGFFCTFCGMKFAANANLRMHLMCHTGEKPFGCRFCDKRFRQKGNAKLHERTHTGEKPYSCPFCQKRFTQRGNMINHSKQHFGKQLMSLPKIEDLQA